MNTTQAFRKPHERDELFVMPNAWREGSVLPVRQSMRLMPILSSQPGQTICLERMSIR